MSQEINWYESHFLKRDNKVKKLYVNCKNEAMYCDGCDEQKRCISLVDISGNVSIICKDCLVSLSKLFD